MGDKSIPYHKQTAITRRSAIPGRERASTMHILSNKTPTVRDTPSKCQLGTYRCEKQP